MRILILGGDGYLGWPTAMHLACQGHDVLVVDNYLKRDLSGASSSGSLFPTLLLQERAHAFERETGKTIDYRMADCTNYNNLCDILNGFEPDTIVHYAELPSAPYSMLGYSEAKRTMDNNLNTTLALAHAVMYLELDCHIIKLGTMGEYGTPNVTIEEGWFDVVSDEGEHRFLYPAEPGSMYHVTKVQDTHMLWLYCKTHGLRVTDIMQGPVYGTDTDETILHSDLSTSFHYDDLFGTVVNRFVAQAVCGHPLTVYGAGGQTRGYINLRDVVKCIELIAENPADKGELRIFNQVTEFFTVQQLAEKVRDAALSIGLSCSINAVPNPRKEEEEHFYRVHCDGLTDLGLKPTHMTQDTLVGMIRAVQGHSDRINSKHILPRHGWRRQLPADYQI